jgi:hypothetical protein
VYDDGDDWRPAFRFRLPCLHGIPWNLLGLAVAIACGWKVGRLIRSMRIRLETIEAILLDQRPTPPRL